jgi:dienelactone hydrolase
MLLFLLRLLVTLNVLLATTVTYAQSLGVVMMHGKWGTPPPWHMTVSNSIGHEGWRVIELTMPWAGNRLYDAPYQSALGQIADAVRELRAKGIKRVVVGGHSFGANAAIAYAGSGGDLDGILAMAPGHAPRNSYNRGTTKSSVDQARQLVASGHGDERLNFVDTNQGNTRSLSARAEVFLSYFDPDGLGDIPTSMSRIGKPVPLLWLIGTGDRLYPSGQAYAYDRAPPHPLSRYIVVSADHANTPSVGREQIIDWLKTIAAQP